MIDNTKEYIICAAIWYHNYEPKIQIHKSLYLPKNIDKGIVILGYRHAQCITTMFITTGEKTNHPHHTQGFLTSDNRFLNRKEAAELVTQNKQVNPKVFSSLGLFSEDLY